MPTIVLCSLYSSSWIWKGVSADTPFHIQEDVLCTGGNVLIWCSESGFITYIAYT